MARGFRGLYELLIGRLRPSSSAPPELKELHTTFAHALPLETTWATGNSINSSLDNGLPLETLFTVR